MRQASKARSEVQYAEKVIGPFRLFRKPVERRGGVLQLLPGQGQDGYGSKITTDLMLQFHGSPKKYRVYCTCYSNAGSHWIRHKGRDLYLGTIFHDEIEEE